MVSGRSIVLALAAGMFAGLAGCAAPHRSAATLGTNAPAARRSFDPVVGQQWIGNGISYGPHRDGQHPEGAGPTAAQVAEDLHLMQPHWRMFRMYGTGAATEAALEAIQCNRLGMKMMLGAWIAPERALQPDGTWGPEIPEAVAANRAQVADVIRLANANPDEVLAISIGNETQVFWSSHRVQMEVIRDYVRQVRAATRVPVSVADDFRFWLTDESRGLADELDFIVVHIYAMWNGQQLENAMPFTKEQYAAVAAKHSGYTLVLGEAGWATKLQPGSGSTQWIHGVAGEPEQKTFHDAFIAWTTAERIANFYFEAFDENWKGGPHPDEVEKHWGLFYSDRTPKPALQDSR